MQSPALMRTYTGRPYKLSLQGIANLHPTIDEVAHGLSHVNRFCGQTNRPYSVAAHSVVLTLLFLHKTLMEAGKPTITSPRTERISCAQNTRDTSVRVLMPGSSLVDLVRQHLHPDFQRQVFSEALHHLLHDGHEAFTGDISGPVKEFLDAQEKGGLLRWLEREIQRAVLAGLHPKVTSMREFPSGNHKAIEHLLVQVESAVLRDPGTVKPPEKGLWFPWSRSLSDDVSAFLRRDAGNASVSSDHPLFLLFDPIEQGSMMKSYFPPATKTAFIGLYRELYTSL